MVGKPVVKGTRIPVELVLGHLAANPDLAELFAAYPELTVEDVKAVLAYAQAAVDSGSRSRLTGTSASWSSGFASLMPASSCSDSVTTPS